MNILLYPNNRIPLVNLDAIGSRPEPVVRDGVWMEVQGNASANEAAHNAFHEEKRIKCTHLFKEEQLKKFQHDVAKRVSQAVQAHKKFIVDSQTTKAEREREILHRSASAAENVTPKKNRCSFNVNPITISSTEKLTSTNLLTKSSFFNEGDPMLQICNEELDGLYIDARKKLAERSIIPKSKVTSYKLDEGQSESLPGGLWGVGTSRDKCVSRIYDKNQRSGKEDKTCLESEMLNESVETVPATEGSDDITLASIQETITSDLTLSCRRLNGIARTSVVNDTKEASKENLPHEGTTPRISSNVHFQLPEDQSCKDDLPVIVTADSASSFVQPSDMVLRSLPSNLESRTVLKTKRSSSNVSDKDIPPFVRPGILAHNQKLADERARWLSRRVFADAERERSRELSRWKEHKQRVERLRVEKERIRSEIEEKSREQVEAVTLANERMKLRAERRESRIKIKKEKEEIKQKKVDRFVKALKSQLRIRLAEKKIELPPLCMCAATFWETNPSTCANNCLFYRNYKAYAKALEAVLEAVERNMGVFHKDALQRSTISLALLPDNENEEDPPASARSHSSFSAISTHLSLSSL